MIKSLYLKKKKKLYSNNIKKENLRNIKNLFIEKKNLLNKEKILIKKIKISSLKNNKIFKSKFMFIKKKQINYKFYFKFSYDFFLKIRTALKYSKDLFNSFFILNKFNIKGLFDLNLNLNSIQKILSKRAIRFRKFNSKKLFLKNFLKNYLRSSKKFTYKNYLQLTQITNYVSKKTALSKNFGLLLNKILIKNRQRIFSILNYGFFFTFLLKSNKLLELNNLFTNKVIFKKNVFFFKYYNINLFKNYLFRNDFLGYNNRYYFLKNDISLNFSEIFNIILSNNSTFNYTKKNILSKINPL